MGIKCDLGMQPRGVTAGRWGMAGGGSGAGGGALSGPTGMGGRWVPG